MWAMLSVQLNLFPFLSWRRWLLLFRNMKLMLLLLRRMKSRKNNPSQKSLLGRS